MGEGFESTICLLQITMYSSYAGIIRIRFAGRRFTCLSAVHIGSPGMKQKQETTFRKPPVKNPCL